MMKKQLAVVLLAAAFCLAMFSFVSPPDQMSVQQNSAKIVAFNANEGHQVNAACRSANGEEVVLVCDQLSTANFSENAIVKTDIGTAPDIPGAAILQIGLNHRTNMTNTNGDRRPPTGEVLYKRDVYQRHDNLQFAANPDISAASTMIC